MRHFFIHSNRTLGGLVSFYCGNSNTTNTFRIVLLAEHFSLLAYVLFSDIVIAFIKKGVSCCTVGQKLRSLQDSLCVNTAAAAGLHLHKMSSLFMQIGSTLALPIDYLDCKVSNIST